MTMNCMYATPNWFASRRLVASAHAAEGAANSVNTAAIAASMRTIDHLLVLRFGALPTPYYNRYSGRRQCTKNSGGEMGRERGKHGMSSRAGPVLRPVETGAVSPLLVVDDVTLQYKTAQHLVTA